MQVIFQILILVACITILVIYLPSILHPIRNAPPIPSPKKARNQVIAALEQLGNISTLVEIGSGWGGLTKRISKLANIKQIVAIEYSPVLAAICYLRLFNKVKVICTDAFSDKGKHIISEADVVVLYAFKEFNDAIYTSLKPNSIIISITFQFKGMQPIAPVINNVYIYRKGTILVNDT